MSEALIHERYGQEAKEVEFETAKRQRMAQEIARLKGITWSHTRGYLPMIATAQRFHELHSSVEIDWQVHSLQNFADASISTLAEKFDLLVLDHPSIGHAARTNALLPLDKYLRNEFLADQAHNSVGHSYGSYYYDYHQWALPIDAAAPISGWRADLMSCAGAEVPTTWPELMDLARRGLVVIPAIPVDSLCHIYMLCCALGQEPFKVRGQIGEEAVVARALEMLRDLVACCDPACFSRNPIQTWDFLACSRKAAYCPFAFGYSNYSRDGYAEHPIEVGGLVSIEGRVCRSVLGGAGLAISRSSKYPEIAAQYAEYVASPLCQRTLYFDSGGQPGYLGAWCDPEVNRRSNGFFQSTLATLEHAYLRPRFDGYLRFHEAAGQAVHAYLTRGGSSKEVVNELNDLLMKETSGSDSN